MTESKGSFDKKTILQMVALCIGGGNIYMLVFMRAMFYDQMIDGMGITNTEFGNMIGLYGLTSIAFYFFGGIVADKFSARKVLVFSYLITALGGMIYATLPSYGVGMSLHLMWGAAHTLTFWASYIKLTRSLGDSEVQGRLFGFLEGGRALAVTLISSVAGLLFTWFDNPRTGLQAIILTYTVMNLVSAVTTWMNFEDTAPTRDNRNLLKNLKVVVRMPQAWIIGFMVMGLMASNSGQHYTTPYMTHVLGMGGGMVMILSFMRSYAIKPIFAPLLGIIADKVGRPSTVLFWSFALLSAVWLGIITVGDGNHMAFAVLMGCLGIMIASIRGVYFATVEESGVPMEYTGAFVGFICTLGMAPDAFISPLIGRILDTYPGAQGYNYSFMILLGFSVLGLVMAFTLAAYNKRSTKKEKEPKVAYQG